MVVIEKRDKLSRNNVLHLWPFVITDLRALGAKGSKKINLLCFIIFSFAKISFFV